MARKANGAPTGTDRSVAAAVERDLARLPAVLAGSALAASALAMAREIDDPGNSATSKSMCQARLADALKELRALAPPEESHDRIDGIADELAQRRQHAQRLAGAKAKARS